jgi:hypothetical protein
VAPLETTVTPNSKDVREGGQEASPKRESGPPALCIKGSGPLPLPALGFGPGGAGPPMGVPCGMPRSPQGFRGRLPAPPIWPETRFEEDCLSTLELESIWPTAGRRGAQLVHQVQ